MRQTVEYKVALNSGSPTAAPEPPPSGFSFEQAPVLVQGAYCTGGPARVAATPPCFTGGGRFALDARVLPLSECEHRQRVDAALEETNRLYGNMLRRLAE